MFKYDIPYAKPGQLTLQIYGIPINVSKKKNYLIDKMKAHRDLMCDSKEGNNTVEYSIVDAEGVIIEKYTFLPNERGHAKKSYYKEKLEKVNYIDHNGFKLIADADGNIITDEDLLKYLYDFRFFNHIPVMITNDALVSMATYKPKTEAEFIALKGLGPKIYAKCGELFLNAIASFTSK